MSSPFGECTTCDISDGLLNKYNVPEGGFFPNLTRYAGSCSASGKAYTVLFAPVSDPRPEINYIDSIPENAIVVVCLTPDLQIEHAPYIKINRAMFGGLMSNRAKYQGANGVVVFGRIRDVDEHRNTGLSVHAYGLGTAAPKGVVKPVAVGVPVEVLGVGTICSGEWLVSDEHGLVRVPSSVPIEPLVEYINVSIRADELVMADIQAGKPAKESQKKHRAVLKNYI